MTMERWVINVSCGPNQIIVMQEAKKLGYLIIGIDSKSQSDLVDRFVNVSTYDHRSVLEGLRVEANFPGIKGVICRSSGPAVTTAYSVARWLDLPSAGEAVANCSVSKIFLYQWALRNLV